MAARLSMEPRRGALTLNLAGSDLTDTLLAGPSGLSTTSAVKNCCQVWLTALFFRVVHITRTSIEAKASLPDPSTYGCISL